MPEIHDLCERVADLPFDRAETEWREILEILRLPLSAQPALARALKRSKWRGAKDCSQYLRTVALRMAERMDLGDPEGDQPISETLRGRQDYDDAIERATPFSYNINEISDQENIYYKLDGDLLNDEGRINWLQVGKLAELDEDEQLVLEARARGMTRERILTEIAQNEEERLRLQASYRRLNRRFPDLREILRGHRPQCSETKVRRG